MAAASNNNNNNINTAKPHPALVLLPKNKQYTGVMVILHGLGDSGHGWESIAKELQILYPYIKFILPHANENPVTLNGGMRMPSWHDIKSLTKIDAEDYAGLQESKEIITTIIDNELKLNAIKSDRIILGGFSQGAAMATITGYQYPQKLAGLVALSGYLPYNGDFSKVIAEENKSTPAFVGHGLADPVVNPKAGEKLAKTLEAAKIPVTYKTYKGMAHSTSLQELKDLAEFIKSVLPGTK